MSNQKIINLFRISDTLGKKSNRIFIYHLMFFLSCTYLHILLLILTNIKNYLPYFLRKYLLLLCFLYSIYNMEFFNVSIYINFFTSSKLQYKNDITYIPSTTPLIPQESEQVFTSLSLSVKFLSYWSSLFSQAFSILEGRLSSSFVGAKSSI